MDMSKYQDIFVAESRENIIILNKSLLEFEKNPATLEPLDEIFRSMHSLKGMAGAMGFEALADFAHTTEDILDQMRKKAISPSAEIIDILFTAFDALETFVEQTAIGKAYDTNFLDLKYQFEALVSPQESVETATLFPDLPIAGLASLDDEATEAIEKIAGLKSPDEKNYDVTVFLDKECQMKGVRAFIVLKTLKEIGTLVQCEPPEHDLEANKFGYQFRMTLKTAKSKEEIEQAVLKIFEIENVRIKTPTSSQESKQKRGPSKKQVAIPQTKSVRVAIEQLDNLMNSVEELVLNRGRLARVTKSLNNSQISGLIEQLARLTTNLRDEVMQARMVPASETLDRYPRLVRDVSKELGKLVDIKIEGGDIELDRTVLDQISDPMVHLLRNAIDHGIESPDQRELHGKPEVGTIKIIVSRERNNVLVSVEDDGKGLDPATLKQKAAENGICTHEEASQLTDEEAYMLVTRPGFSTSSVVTDVSGRGVGMDVVRTRIRSLGGTLSIQSTINVGTNFGLRLPLTLAIIQGLEVDVYGETYVIPLANIMETMDIYPEAIQTIKQEEVTILRGDIVPLVRLGEVLETPGAVETAMVNQEGLAAVIVEVGSRRRGLVVSGLIGQNEIVVKPLRGIINMVNLFTGVTILGDGQPAFILDVASFL
ncbi:MAG: hypothetical protein B6244_07580 [Candidatus Cloacimonetes bacterium 4572_55]|nr:MAG: hypothetical protein B6244_07580 [Candidatus Cloacimonetes bacterium 4572_55]